MDKPRLGERVKTWLEVVKLIAIFFFVGVLVAKTDWVVDWCNDSFESCEFLGLSIKKQKTLEEAEIQIRDQRELINDLESALDKLSKGVTEYQKDDSIQANLAELRSFNTRSQELKAKADIDLESIGEILNSSAPEGIWYLVIAGNKVYEDALRVEEEFPAANASIVYRNGTYRNIVEYSSRIFAQKEKLKFEGKGISDAYIVNKSTWCPSIIGAGSVKSCGMYDLYSGAWAQKDYFLQLDGDSKLKVLEIDKDTGRVRVEVDEVSFELLQDSPKLVELKSGLNLQITLVGIAKKGYTRREAGFFDIETI